ncbi:MAG TPA: immunoglobulin domain-containing protein [Verrucomicrobiae bacterium]
MKISVRADSKPLLAVALLTAIPFGMFGQAPSITQQPASQTIFCGDPVTFSVTATGGGTLRYQWFRDGAALSSATRTSYTIAAVASGDQNAAFSVRVTNTLGSVTSAAAVLTVDPGLPGAAVTNRVLNYTNLWKYNQTNNLDGVNWPATNYSDATWPSGPGLLAYENNSLITTLIKTTLADPRSPPAGLSAGHAYYFRTAVSVTNDLLPGTLLANIRADDGAMIYINGGEAKRVRMPSGTITNLSFATGYPPDSSGGSDATVDEYLEMPGWGLRPGTNVVAASVHQVNSSSSDIVWGMTLDVVRYQRVRDTNAPTVSEVIPSPGSTLAALNQVEIHFNKGVKGVDATDLLINGTPATNVTAYAPNAYVFDFAPQAPGVVQVAWNAAHGIVDLTANSNRFAGGSYTYTVDPNAVASQVLITEFMAGNSKTIRDEDGSYSDWVEIYNAGLDPVTIGGWYLTDDPATLRKWQFPAGVTLPSRSYLLVWASGKNRTNSAAPLHTSFKLSKTAGSFLGLVYSDGATLVSYFPAYPQQYDDISYGRDRLDSSLTGYCATPTPRQPNAGLGSGFGPEVIFSVPGGTFQQAFTLSLSSADPTAVIRYFLVTNGTTAAMTGVPNATSPAYTGPLTISGTTQVRARAFPTQPGYFPGSPHSETYLQLDSSVAQFSSDLPIVVFHNMGGGDIAATADQFMTMQVFDTRYGRSTPTNAPDQSAQGIFHRRGQATFWNPKPNLRVETRDDFGDDLDVPLAGFPAESDWVFYGIDQYDKVLMHNRLSHQLYRDMGHYTSRTRFVEVYLKTGLGTAGPVTSSDYYGLYVLEEKIKIGNHRVDIDKLHPENTTAPSVTGGYVLSIDKTKAGDPPQLNAANASMTYVDPDYYAITNSPAQQQYISDYLNQFYSALMNSSTWRDPATGYAAYIDLDSWIDYHLHQTLVFNVDALRISAYFYKPREGKIVQGPLWDFDRCFGTRTGDDARAFNPRRWRSADMDGGTDMFNAGNTFHNPWYGRLFTDPDFWQRWIDRYQELRKSIYSTTNLTARIEQFGDEVREATGREYVRWAGGGGSDTTPRSGAVTGDGLTYTFPVPGTWQGELDYTKWWFSNRVEFVDTNFLNPPVFSSGGGPISSGFTLTVTTSTREPNSTIYYTLDGTDPRLPGGAVSPSAISRLNTATITLNANARVFARNYNAAHQNLTGANNPPLSSSWSGPTVATFYTVIPPLRVTELMYHPLPPPAGNTNDADNFEFIGLMNISGSALNLQGFRLRGGIHFVFPSLTLGAGQEVVVVKDLAAFQSRYGTGPLVAGVYTNNLANDGDHVILEGPLQEPILDFTYNDGWYPTTDGLGFSLVIRDPNAGLATWSLKESWRPSAAIYGSPGLTDPAPPSIPGVLVNEVLAHTDPPMQDSIELFNPGSSPANVGGWLLTDDAHTPLKYRIPDGTFISAGGYLTIRSNEFSVGPNAFALSSIGEEVYLFSADANTNLTGYGHGFAFGASPNGVAFCRYVNSLGEEQLVLESQNTLGTNNAYPRVGPVVITEIMYHPPDLPGGVEDWVNEYVELQNIAVTNVPLYDPNAVTNTWHLRHAVDYDFPTGAIMAPGTRALVVGFDPARYPAQLAAFKTKYNVPVGVAVFGPWDGKLNNAGERIEVYRPDYPNITPANSFIPYYLVEAVGYQPTSPWPTNAAGGGASLQRIYPAQFGNEPLNWQGMPPTAGQAPTTPTIDTQPVDLTIAVGANATFVVSASGAPPLAYQWQVNGIDITGATLSSYTVLNAQPANEGNYAVVVRNSGGTVTSAAARLTVLYPPVITDPPLSQTVLQGTPVTLGVAAGGSAPLSYQWSLNGIPLAGQSQSSLTLASAQTADAGGYSVVVTNDVGSVTSAVATLTVLVPPSITAQPVNRTVVATGNAVFTVTATGTAPLSYQWRFNGVNIGGATLSSYTVAGAQPANEGNYSVVVTNLAGSITSGNASLTVLVPPNITAQPTNVTVMATSNVVFAVTATGTAPLSYQWRFNGVNIGGATLSSYTVANAQPAHEGNYSVLVTNLAGSITSGNASLTVLVPPTLTAHPTNITVMATSNAVFTVRATGTAPLSYQWRFNGVNISGATLSSYTVANAQPANEGNYSVVVTNLAGSITSGNASLTVLVPPSIVTPPESQSVVVGSNVTFTVTAAGTTPLSYQWRLNSTILPGATLSSYDVLNAGPADAGSYRVVVTNAAGSVTSPPATLTVLGPPAILTQPTNQVVAVGSNATFIVAAAGSAPLSYQWYFEATNLLAWRTNAELVLSNVTLADAGNYLVVITNAAGLATSETATLTVLMPPSITLQPAGQAAEAGSDIALNVTAAGAEPLTYQWRFNGTAIAGATLTVCLVTNVQPSNAGDYTVVVSNLVGSVESAVATVDVSVPPLFISNFERAGSISGISVQTWQGLTYLLEYKNDLRQATWTPLLPAVAGTGGVLVLRDTNASPEASRFYRVRSQ